MATILGNRRRMAGLQGGPGAHTTDANPALLRANGFVRSVQVPRCRGPR